MTTIRVLVEERTLVPGLKTEHGLSLWLETGGQTWLFDAGQSGAAVLNSRRLGIDLATIEGIILSHGHYDHTGGLKEVLKTAGPKRIYAHPGIFRARANVKKDKKSRSIGCPWSGAALRKDGAEFVFSREPREIAPRMHLSGEIPLVTDFEQGEPHLVIRDKWKFTPDTFVDEQYLVIESGAGLIMVNGCCHSGLINSLRHLRLYQPGKRIRAIIGGLHLRSADPGTLDKIMGALKEFDPEFIIAGHCTGERAETELARGFGRRFKKLETGAKFDLEAVD